MAGNTVTYYVESESLQLHPRNLSGGVYRALAVQKWGGSELERITQAAAYGHGLVEMANGVLRTARKVDLKIISWCGSEAAAWTEYDMLKRLFRPSRPVGYMRQAWTNNAGAVSRDLYVRSVRQDSMSWPPSPDAPRFIGNPAGGVIEFPVSMESQKLPLWYAAEESSAKSLTTALQNFTLTNDGEWPIGIRAVLSGLAGTWTSIVIQNTTTGGPDSVTGGSVTWTSAAFANAHALDWRHTDHTVVTFSTGTSIATPGAADIVLWPGDNTVTWIGVGGSSGTITFYWRELFL